MKLYKNNTAFWHELRIGNFSFKLVKREKYGCGCKLDAEALK